VLQADIQYHAQLADQAELVYLPNDKTVHSGQHARATFGVRRQFDFMDIIFRVIDDQPTGSSTIHQTQAKADPLKVEDQADYIERTIREEKADKGSFLSCYSAKNTTVDPEFVREFETLSKEEQYGLFRP